MVCVHFESFIGLMCIMVLAVTFCLRPAAVVLRVLLVQARAVTLRDERAAERHRDTISDADSLRPPPADWQCRADAAAACAACPVVSPLSLTLYLLLSPLYSHSLTHTVTQKPKSVFDPLRGI
jgi:hypothetical protein